MSCSMASSCRFTSVCSRFTWVVKERYWPWPIRFHNFSLARPLGSASTGRTRPSPGGVRRPARWSRRCFQTVFISAMRVCQCRPARRLTWLIGSSCSRYSRNASSLLLRLDAAVSRFFLVLRSLDSRTYCRRFCEPYRTSFCCT